MVRNTLILRCERSEPRRTRGPPPTVPTNNLSPSPRITLILIPSLPQGAVVVRQAHHDGDERCERRGQPGEGVSCAPRGAEGRRPAGTCSSFELARTPRPEAPAPGTRERLLLFLRRECVPGPRHHDSGEGQPLQRVIRVASEAGVRLHLSFRGGGRCPATIAVFVAPSSPSPLRGGVRGGGYAADTDVGSARKCAVRLLHLVAAERVASPHPSSPARGEVPLLCMSHRRASNSDQHPPPCGEGWGGGGHRLGVPSPSW